MNKLRDSGRGAVMVELAIMLPVLALLVFGIAEIGRALYQQNTLAKAVESGARYLGRASGILDANCARVGDESGGLWRLAADKAVNMIVYGTEDPGDPPGVQPLLPNLDGENVVTITESGPTTVTEGGYSTTPACVITVSAAVDFEFLYLPMLGLDFFPPLNAAAEERWIGE